MSDDDFSWAPFGGSDKEPLPPLPPHGEEQASPLEWPAVPPPASEPQPPASEPPAEADSEPVAEESEPPPVVNVPPVSPPPPMQFGLEDVQQLAMTASDTVTRRVGVELAEPGTKEAGQSLLWGIIGVTVCPVLVPSIMAIVYGNQARAKSVGLGGESTKGAWGRALGWIGVGFWALVAVLAIIGAFTSN